MNPEMMKMYIYQLMAQGHGMPAQQQQQQMPQQNVNVLDPVRQQLAQLMMQTQTKPMGIPGLGQFNQGMKQTPGINPHPQNMTVPLMPHRPQMSGSPFQSMPLQQQNLQNHMMGQLRQQTNQSAGYNY